ncbi:hypothetical protein IAR55_003204 [Kwoniella newhampshirensis]|uniref:Uncharacterized protein n=1 Tax=Kwoniella newhampshirensis TaxID=1651941 RepID=A0AAW0YN47_9TREE
MANPEQQKRVDRQLANRNAARAREEPIEDWNQGRGGAQDSPLSSRSGLSSQLSIAEGLAALSSPSSDVSVPFTQYRLERDRDRVAEPPRMNIPFDVNFGGDPGRLAPRTPPQNPLSPSPAPSAGGSTLDQNVRELDDDYADLLAGSGEQPIAGFWFVPQGCIFSPASKAWKACKGEKQSQAESLRVSLLHHLGATEPRLGRANSRQAKATSGYPSEDGTDNQPSSSASASQSSSFDADEDKTPRAKSLSSKSPSKEARIGAKFPSNEPTVDEDDEFEDVDDEDEGENASSTPSSAPSSSPHQSSSKRLKRKISKAVAIPPGIDLYKMWNQVQNLIAFVSAEYPMTVETAMKYLGDSKDLRSQKMSVLRAAREFRGLSKGQEKTAWKRIKELSDAADTQIEEINDRRKLAEVRLNEQKDLSKIQIGKANELATFHSDKLLEQELEYQKATKALKDIAKLSPEQIKDIAISHESLKESNGKLATEVTGLNEKVEGLEQTVKRLASVMYLSMKGTATCLNRLDQIPASITSSIDKFKADHVDGLISQASVEEKFNEFKVNHVDPIETKLTDLPPPPPPISVDERIADFKRQHHDPLSVTIQNLSNALPGFIEEKVKKFKDEHHDKLSTAVSSLSESIPGTIDSQITQFKEQVLQPELDKLVQSTKTLGQTTNKRLVSLRTSVLTLHNQIRSATSPKSFRDSLASNVPFLHRLPLYQHLLSSHTTAFLDSTSFKSSLEGFRDSFGFTRKIWSIVTSQAAVTSLLKRREVGVKIKAVAYESATLEMVGEKLLELHSYQERLCNTLKSPNLLGDAFSAHSQAVDALKRTVESQAATIQGFNVSLFRDLLFLTGLQRYAAHRSFSDAFFAAKHNQNQLDRHLNSRSSGDIIVLHVTRNVEKIFEMNVVKSKVIKTVVDDTAISQLTTALFASQPFQEALGAFSIDANTVSSLFASKDVQRGLLEWLLRKKTLQDLVSDNVFCELVGELIRSRECVEMIRVIISVLLISPNCTSLIERLASSENVVKNLVDVPLLKATVKDWTLNADSVDRLFRHQAIQSRLLPINVPSSDLESFVDGRAKVVANDYMHGPSGHEAVAKGILTPFTQGHLLEDNRFALLVRQSLFGLSSLTTAQWEHIDELILRILQRPAVADHFESESFAQNLRITRVWAEDVIWMGRNEVVNVIKDSELVESPDGDDGERDKELGQDEEGRLSENGYVRRHDEGEASFDGLGQGSGQMDDFIHMGGFMEGEPDTIDNEEGDIYQPEDAQPGAPMDLDRPAGIPRPRSQPQSPPARASPSGSTYSPQPPAAAMSSSSQTASDSLYPDESQIRMLERAYGLKWRWGGLEHPDMARAREDGEEIWRIFDQLLGDSPTPGTIASAHSVNLMGPRRPSAQDPVFQRRKEMIAARERQGLFRSVSRGDSMEVVQAWYQAANATQDRVHRGSYVETPMEPRTTRARATR